jgi:hypothetical protein
MKLYLGLPKIIKHNPSKDKRPGLAKSHLKTHTKSAHCNDTLWKERIYKNQTEKHQLPSPEKEPTITWVLHAPSPKTPNSTQLPQTRPEKRGITLTRRSMKQVPQRVQATRRSGNSDTTAAWDSRIGMRWQRQLGSAWWEISDENT